MLGMGRVGAISCRIPVPVKAQTCPGANRRHHAARHLPSGRAPFVLGHCDFALPYAGSMPAPTGGVDPPRKYLPRKKIPADLRSLARSHTERAIQILAGIAERGESEAARVTACAHLLDRGWARPNQPRTGEDGEGDLRITVRTVIEASRDRYYAAAQQLGPAAAQRRLGRHLDPISQSVSTGECLELRHFLPLHPSPQRPERTRSPRG